MPSRATRRMTVGNVEVLAIPDGAADLGGPPVARALEGEVPVDWGAYHERFPDGFHGPEHRWRIHNTCYLLRSRGRTVLVDLGVGVGPYPRYRGMEGVLPESLRDTGVAAEDIDTVFLTHAHPDHVGWAIREDGRPRFPAARYQVHQADWDEFARRTPPPRYIERFVEPLERYGVLDLLPGETPLTDEVVAFETPGHTPGHMSLLITSGSERAVVTGDVVVSPFYVSEPGRPFGADMDVAQGVRTRTALVERIEAEGMRLAAGHFPAPGFGEIVRIEGRRWFRAL